MVRVNPDRHPTDHRSQSPKHTSLGGVGMHDVGAEPADLPADTPECPEIVKRPRRPTEPRNNGYRQFRIPQGQEIRFITICRADEKAGLKAIRIDLSGQDAGLPCGATHVHPRDDPHDTNGTLPPHRMASSCCHAWNIKTDHNKNV